MHREKKYLKVNGICSVGELAVNMFTYTIYADIHVFTLRKIDFEREDMHFLKFVAHLT